jgi:uncharacterized membrane protein YeaQ/YmgE (transglycosylase-associated protein family)
MEQNQLIFILLIGLIAGWLAGLIMRGRGLGLFVNIIVGVIGAFLGSWLLHIFNISVSGGILSTLGVAVFGSVILLILASIINRK